MDLNHPSSMWKDLLLQAATILVPLTIFLFIHDIPQTLFHKLRHLLTQALNRSTLQSKRHFVAGAQLLSQARSTNPPSISLASRAASEADLAISLDPTDAAAHVLKALALELQGFRASAIDSLDAALSPLAVGSLSDEERGDALCKRAEMRVRLGRVEDEVVVVDLVEAVRVSGGRNARALGLLGECYERMGRVAEAREAYEEAVRVRPDLDEVREALGRLGET